MVCKNGKCEGSIRIERYRHLEIEHSTSSTHLFFDSAHSSLLSINGPTIIPQQQALPLESFARFLWQQQRYERRSKLQRHVRPVVPRPDRRSLLTSTWKYASEGHSSGRGSSSKYVVFLRGGNPTMTAGFFVGNTTASEEVLYPINLVLLVPQS